MQDSMKNFLPGILAGTGFGIFGNLLVSSWIEFNNKSNIGSSDYYLTIFGISLAIIIIITIGLFFYFYTNFKTIKVRTVIYSIFLIILIAIVVYAVISQQENWVQIGIFVATLIYAGLTYALVNFTRDMAETSEKTRKTQIQPFIVASIKENKIDFHYIDLIIENVGPGIARNITFIVESSGYTLPSEYHQKIEELYIFKKGIKSLGPHQNIRFIIANLAEKVGPVEKTIEEIRQEDFKFKLKISCENIEGEKCPDQEYEIDLLIFWGLVFLQNPPPVVIVNQSEKHSS